MSVKETKTLTVSVAHPQGAGFEGLRPFPILAIGQRADVSLSVRVEIIGTSEMHVLAKAVIENHGKETIRLSGIRWAHDGMGGAPAALHFKSALSPMYYSTENFRGDYFGTGTTESNRYFYPLGNQRIECGLSEDSLFPGVFFRAESEPIGLLAAQATQEKLLPVFRLSGKIMEADRWIFEIEERVFGIDALEVAPGGKLYGEQMIFLVVYSNDPQTAARTYFEIIGSKSFSRRDELNPLFRERIYCSWNYDFFADIDEKSMLAQIPVIKKNFPSVKFLQIDDGYQSCHEPGQRAMIDICYGDLEKPFDPARFPEGPKAFCDRVKAEGLRPAIWLGLWASNGSKMLKDHPEWILCDDTGQRISFNQWYGGTSILDPSISGVRDYLRKLCGTVFCEWGFEGVKLDFSSFAFNMKRARFSVPGLTSVQLRHELESIFREFLPTDGFFGWCVVCGTAQPFLSQADYFRCAVDINHAEWREVRRVAFWCVNTNILLQERPCIPNMDSIGWSQKCDEAGWLTWLNLCIINGGAIELSGDLRKLDKNRIAALAKTLELSNPRLKVRCLDLKTGEMEQPPSLWFAENTNGGGLLGIFNWSDKEASINLASASALTVRKIFKDVWTEMQVYRHGLPSSITLQGRSSKVFCFSK